MDLLKNDGSLSPARRLGNLEAERFTGREWLLDQVHALDLLELAHGLGGLGGDLTEAVIELAQIGDLLLLVLVSRILPLVAGIPLLKKGAVIPRVRLQTALGDLINRLDDFIHKLPVVRDQEYGAGIGLEVILQPEQGDKVEVIGRLIEQEQIGLHDKKSGEMGTHDPAATQFLGLPFEVLLLVAQTSEDLLCLGLDLGVTQGGMLGGGFAILRRIDGARLFEFSELFFERWNLSGSTCGHIKDGLIARGLALLGEMPDHRPLITLDRA